MKDLSETVRALILEDENGNRTPVPVLDKYPQMEDVHIEGRRYVEVSVELFVQMAAEMGMRVVDPEGETK